MAREFDGPLTKADIAWLSSRYPESYVERMVALHGTKKGKKDEAPEEPENGPETGEGTEGEGQAPEGTEEAGDGTEESDEDLIGDLFDPKDHTENEIKEHLEAFPDDRDRVLGLEAEGRNRKGVMAL